MDDVDTTLRFDGADEDLDLDAHPAQRTCGFDSGTCPSTMACGNDRTCHREDDLQAAGWCTDCDPIRQFTLPDGRPDLRSYKAHASTHQEPVPCPKCGRPTKPRGLTRHLRGCGVVVTPGVSVAAAALAEAQAAVPRRDRREIPLESGGTLVLVLHLDDLNSMLDLSRADRAFVLSVFDLLDAYLEEHP